MEKKKTKIEKEIAKEEIVRTGKNECQDEQCPVHGELAGRGRIFEGTIIKKFPRRIVIEFERTVYIRKYERYIKKKTRLHARLPKCQEDKVRIGDYVQIRECRPLSKIIHFVYVKTVRGGERK